MGITGIVGVPLEVQVIGCTHVHGKAFWCTKNDGSEPPDLWFDGFPQKGRMMLLQRTIVVSCWECRNSLDAIAKEYGQLLQ